jgi:3-methyl-2-oxobutanoate hydroxymethyltransferase
MFGLYPRFKPRMAKLYADAGKVIGEGLSAYVREVREGIFPQPENYFEMADDAYEELRRNVDAPAAKTSTR